MTAKNRQRMTVTEAVSQATFGGKSGKLEASLTSSSRKNILVRTEEDPGRVLAWSVAQRVRIERERQGLRQEDLAAKAGLKRPNITRLEKGRHLPSLITLLRIAKALHLDLSSLVASPPATDVTEFVEMAEAGISEWGRQLDEEDGKP